MTVGMLARSGTSAAHTTRERDRCDERDRPRRDRPRRMHGAAMPRRGGQRLPDPGSSRGNVAQR